MNKPMNECLFKSQKRDLNPRSSDYKSDALTNYAILAEKDKD